MMIAYITVVVIVIIVIVAGVIGGIISLIELIKGIDSHDVPYESPEKQAGRWGEEYVIDQIRGVLREDDHLFSNVEIEYDGKPAELDSVVVNKFGVFIFEIKNYSGDLVGEEDDYEWEKYKMSDGGYVYFDLVKNPIKQVKRQVYLFAKYLDYYGKHVWVDGYAILLQDNSPIDSEYILSSVSDIDRVIHTRGKNRLSQKDVEQIIHIVD